MATGPQLLPDGDSLLFSITTRGAWDDGEIVVESLTTGQRRPLIFGGASAKYLPTGHIVYAFGEDLYAIAFDPVTLTVSGRAQRVVRRVMRALSLWQTGLAYYDVSASGTLAYMTSQQSPEYRVLWVDRDTGVETPLGIEPRVYFQPRISPDGSRLIVDESNVANDIWVWNFETGTPTLLALGAEGGDFAAWTADSERIAYHPSFRPMIEWRAANNAGTPELLIDGRPDGLDPYHPEIFDPTGRYLVMRGRATRGSSNDLALITLGEQPELEWMLQGPYSETQPSVSPNGRWLAYASNEFQRSEIFVRPFPNVDDAQYSITNQGGTGPVWSREGDELFYIEPGTVPRLVSVSIDTEADSLDIGERTVIMDWPYRADEFTRQYDVSLDGQRFIALEPLGDEGDASRIIVVENWTEELQRLVPTH